MFKFGKMSSTWRLVASARSGQGSGEPVFEHPSGAGKRALLAIVIALTVWSVAKAEPSSPRVKLVEVRPYIGNNNVFIRTNVDAVCGTSMFRILTSETNGREAYAAALAAITSGRSVVLEVSNVTGCAGWGTVLQSIYIVAD